MRTLSPTHPLANLPRFRRHLPPPHTNFEKLQDILRKRKGLTLDVSSSGALAASLDKCIVRLLLLLHHEKFTINSPPQFLRTRTNLHSTHSCVLWQLVACCRQSISAQAVLHGILSVIMALPVPYILISLARSEDMRVSLLFSSLRKIKFQLCRCIGASSTLCRNQLFAPACHSSF